MTRRVDSASRIYVTVLIAALGLLIGACDSVGPDDARTTGDPVASSDDWPHADLAPADAWDMKPTHRESRFQVGGIVTLDDERYYGMARGAIPRSDGTLLATGNHNKSCSVWLYDPAGQPSETREKAIPGIDGCREATAFREGMLLVGRSSDSTRVGVLVDLNGEVSRRYEPFPSSINLAEFTPDSRNSHLVQFPKEVGGLPSLSGGAVMLEDDGINATHNTLQKYSDDFQLEWRLPLPEAYWAWDVTTMTDGDLLAVGHVGSGNVYADSGFVTRVTPSGSVRWIRTYPELRDLLQVLQLNESEYLLMGDIKTSDWFAWFAIMDEEGAITWRTDESANPELPISDAVLASRGSSENGFSFVAIGNSFANPQTRTFTVEPGGSLGDWYDWPVVAIDYLRESDRDCWLRQFVPGPNSKFVAVQECYGSDWQEHPQGLFEPSFYSGNTWTELVVLE